MDTKNMLISFKKWSLNFFNKNLWNFQQYSAFTLAEVLIVLGIIGIIASLTISTLINNYQKHIYVTGLKKFYSTTNQALHTIANDYGSPGSLTGTGLFAAGTTTISFGDEFIKYFKVAKNCKTDKGCWPDQTLRYFDTSYNMAANTWDQDTTYYKFVTADGMSVMIKKYAQDDCKGIKPPTQPNTVTNASKICGYLYVDVTGLKGPNIFGRDTFEFFITDGKGPALDPEGVSSNSGSWMTSGHCTSSYPIGQSCAARVMEEGWQMNY